jgi:hypothetical protein
MIMAESTSTSKSWWVTIRDKTVEAFYALAASSIATNSFKCVKNFLKK